MGKVVSSPQPVVLIEYSTPKMRHRLTIAKGILNFLSSKDKAQKFTLNLMKSRSTVFSLLALVAAALLIAACQSPEATAQKLFAERKYAEVISKYPDTQFARRAKAMMAEDLLEAGKFQEVLENYPDTRAAYLAHEEKAKMLYNEKKYTEVIAQFPNSPLATEAERVLSEDLFNQGLLDSLMRTYPNSPRGQEVKTARAQTDYEAAKKMKGQAQIDALENILRSYTDTPVYKDAANLLREVRKK